MVSLFKYTTPGLLRNWPSSGSSVFTNVFGSTLRSTVWLNASTVYPTNEAVVRAHSARSRYTLQTMYEQVNAVLECSDLHRRECHNRYIRLLLFSFAFPRRRLAKLLFGKSRNGDIEISEHNREIHDVLQAPYRQGISNLIFDYWASVTFFGSESGR